MSNIIPVTFGGLTFITYPHESSSTMRRVGAHQLRRLLREGDVHAQAVAYDDRRVLDGAKPDRAAVAKCLDWCGESTAFYAEWAPADENRPATIHVRRPRLLDGWMIVEPESAIARLAVRRARAAERQGKGDWECWVSRLNGFGEIRKHVSIITELPRQEAMTMATAMMERCRAGDFGCDRFLVQVFRRGIRGGPLHTRAREWEVQRFTVVVRT